MSREISKFFPLSEIHSMLLLNIVIMLLDLPGEWMRSHSVCLLNMYLLLLHVSVYLCVMCAYTPQCVWWSVSSIVELILSFFLCIVPGACTRVVTLIGPASLPSEPFLNPRFALFKTSDCFWGILFLGFNIFIDISVFVYSVAPCHCCFFCCYRSFSLIRPKFFVFIYLFFCFYCLYFLRSLKGPH